MTLRERETYRWKMLMWCIWCTLILCMNSAYISLWEKIKMELESDALLFFILRICSLAIRTTSNLLTVVPSWLFFLGMKHDFENTADLEGVLCVSGSIFSNYTLYLFFCPAQGELTVRKKVFNRHVMDLHCPAFMCLVRLVRLFILILSPCCCSNFSEKCAAQSSQG